MSEQRLVYQIDAAHIIRRVGGDWEAFARANNAVALAEGAVGTSLDDHITGDEVRHVYDLLYRRVRETGRPVSVPYRCDSPRVRRQLVLHISSLGGGSLRFVSHILREEPHTQPILLIDATSPRTGDMITMCAWCKKVRVADDRWLELEDAVASMGLFNQVAFPMISHGICSDCYGTALSA
jgi:hypothetical protein